MICPVCKENIDEGVKFCSSCGAEVAAFVNISPDKIIVNQTPEQQAEVGDDSVTQLIPENYMEAKGDDEVTQLIPENYMEAKGDDSVTQLIPENYMTAKGDDSATMLLDPLDGKQPVGAPTGFKLANQAPPTYGQMPMGNQMPYQQGMTNMAQAPYQQSMPMNNQMPYQQNVEPKQNNMLPIVVIGGLVLLCVIALAIIFG